jgi:hypothetical protein
MIEAPEQNPEVKEVPLDKPEEGPPVTPPATTVNTTTGAVQQQIITAHMDAFFGATRQEPLAELPQDLPKLPPGSYSFRDPKHEGLLGTLKERRIVMLTSYREKAAYAAAHSLLTDSSFDGKKHRILFPARQRDKERPDLELMSLANEAFLGKESQVLLIEVEGKCTFLDSLLHSSQGAVGSVCQTLDQNDSYLVLSIAEDLVESEVAGDTVGEIFTHSVPYLRYLLSPAYADKAESMEARLRTALGSLSTQTERREHYQRIADQLQRGTAVFEKFLDELEQAMHLEPEARNEKLRPVDPPAVFAGKSDAHRAAAFVAACFPDLNQRDFDRFVRLLLGDATTPVASSRPAYRRDGKLLLIQEEKQERWSERWLREADSIFADCHLRTIVSGDGSWAVDFCESYLRDELRKYLQSHHPWYLRHQCQRLQRSGVLFSPDLSPKAAEGLVQLFVERAIVDPTGFGSIWLLELVLSARSALSGDDLPGAAEDALSWLADQLAQAQLRAIFLQRLTMLVREMLDHEVLRPVVNEFLSHLVGVQQHDALLDVILELAPRLRFSPHFDPLIWMRRLLDEGSTSVLRRTIDRLTDLAWDSRLRIYDFLAKIRTWLPEDDEAKEGLSVSARVALEFPFLYCAAVAGLIEPGVWPSQHPLFYALPSDPLKASEARAALAMLVAWALEVPGIDATEGNAADPLHTPETVRLGHVADLIEHWAWVLEGATDDGPAEGRALFEVVAQELECRLSPRERTWLQRSWQRRQDELIREAADPAKNAAQRRIPLARRKKLERLRVRFTSVPQRREL